MSEFKMLWDRRHQEIRKKKKKHSLFEKQNRSAPKALIFPSGLFVWTLQPNEKEGADPSAARMIPAHTSVSFQEKVRNVIRHLAIDHKSW